MNEDMMTEAERASKLAEPAANDTPTRGKGVFYVHTLGCQMNVHDSERIAGVLEADGYVPATEEQYLNHDIDLIVMNTCAVRENAAERMYGIMDKVTRAFCSDASVRAWFRMDQAFADLCAMDAGYDCQIPLARVDIFLDEDTGSYTFCELNTDGSAGMVVTDAVCQAVRMTPSFEMVISLSSGRW